MPLCIQMIQSVPTQYFFFPHTDVPCQSQPPENRLHLFKVDSSCLSVATSLEDRCRRAPEAAFSSDVVRCGQRIPLTNTPHPPLFLECLPTQWVIGYNCDVLAVGIGSDLKPFGKAGALFHRKVQQCYQSRRSRIQGS